MVKESEKRKKEEKEKKKVGDKGRGIEPRWEGREEGTRWWDGRKSGRGTHRGAHRLIYSSEACFC